MRSGPVADAASNEAILMAGVGHLLDLLEPSVLIANGTGNILLANQHARRRLEAQGSGIDTSPNLFTDVLHADPQVVLEQAGRAESEAEFKLEGSSGKATARIQWLPEQDWLIVRIQDVTDSAEEIGTGPKQPTVQELLQEREITYRNLLAAYLRLQEVNRQKTVFLASAAHELKTPLAVIKGYYDLLLSGSLGKLAEKQRDILQESKESCERLVRLVSMFLNYSALESGRLILHLRENDVRDCIGELAARWHEAFGRKQVRLDTVFNGELPIFKFDYQKVQQAVANLLDNALKHTPAGGHVTLFVELYFWERRASEGTQPEERRRVALQAPNSLKVSVTDSGPGIAPEHHQEIFEDFVRVDRTSSGMGLGLAIAKRLVQAHGGKIWVDSEPRRGCTFTFLLPMDAV